MVIFIWECRVHNGTASWEEDGGKLSKQSHIKITMTVIFIVIIVRKNLKKRQATPLLPTWCRWRWTEEICENPACPAAGSHHRHQHSWQRTSLVRLSWSGHGNDTGLLLFPEHCTLVNTCRKQHPIKEVIVQHSQSFHQWISFSSAALHKGHKRSWTSVLYLYLLQQRILIPSLNCTITSW